MPTPKAPNAGAPMDQVLLSLDMPHTLYTNNDVAPAIHCQRSLGGPVYSAASLLGSLLWRTLSAPVPLPRAGECGLPESWLHLDWGFAASPWWMAACFEVDAVEQVTRRSG
ncbi:MAG: hypothetical protein IPH82_13460 [Chloroflexi bacterium]|nr:hypothetical protein [Chloroflexota bacterium]